MIDDALKGIFGAVTVDPLIVDRCHDRCEECTGGCHCDPGDPQTDSVCTQISHVGTETWKH